MRLMSFALTTDQILNQTKTVTRRKGWLHIKIWETIQPVNKCMGLKPGESPLRLGPPIRILSVRREPINAITQEDVIREGFPEWTPEQFIQMYCRYNKCKPDDLCTRIEFTYFPF